MIKTAGRILLVLLVSIAVPLLAGLAHQKNGTPYLSAFDQVALGAIIFIVIELIRLGSSVNELLLLRQQENAVWELERDVDITIANLRTNLVKVINERPIAENLLGQYFDRVLRSVGEEVREAANEQTVRLDELTFGTTNVLLDIMTQRKGCDLLRLVHTLDARPNNFDFSVWAKNYYTRLTRMASDKHVRIQRLFIYSEQADLETDLAKKLFQFHLNRGYDAPKIFKRSDWSILVKPLRGLALKSVGEDFAQSEFGVWGDLIGYLGVHSASDRMLGYYTMSHGDISHLSEVFDSGYALASPAPPQGTKPITVEELFGSLPLVMSPTTSTTDQMT